MVPHDCLESHHSPGMFPSHSADPSVDTCRQVSSIDLLTSPLSPAPEVSVQVSHDGPPASPASPVPEVPYQVSSAHNPDRWIQIRPSKIPFAHMEEIVGRLKQYLLGAFEGPTFNTDGKFPRLHRPDGHIHLKSNAFPKAPDNPIPVPFHLKEATATFLFPRCWVWDYCTIPITKLHFKNINIDGSAQDCRKSFANALELLQSCTKPPI